MTQLKPIAEMTYDEMHTESQELLERLIALQRQMSFVPEYREQARDEECLGLIVSHRCEWDGMAIMRTAYEALEDANYHSEAAVLEMFLEADDSLSLARKITAMHEEGVLA